MAWSSVRSRTLAQAWITTHAPRVLLAEDDDQIRELLAASLRRDGIEVIEARNGSELKRLLDRGVLQGERAEGLDLVVSDIVMPDLSGLEVLAAVRELRDDTPFILITAHGDPSLRREAERLGASALFVKPFELADLETAIVHLVR
jgi:DNA-binding NtrC family response regulator